MKQLLILFVFLVKTISAQEPITFANDHFSGISAAPVSPTQPYLNEQNFDINLFAEDVFAENNYLYISRQSILGITKAEIATANPKKGISGETDSDVMDYFNKNTATFHVSSQIMGPSFSLTKNILEKKFTFGIFTRLQTQASGIRIDNYLRFENSGTDPPETYLLQPFKTNVMNWGEIALHISTGLGENTENQWIFGANLKYELGLDAVFINNKKNSILRRIPQEDESFHTEISDYDVDTFYVTSYDFENEKYTAKKQGSGFGLDFGIAYLKKDENSHKYNFKIALNLLDFGYINFQGAQHHLKGSTFEFESMKNNKFKTPEKYMQLISEKIYGNPNQSLVGNQLKIGLPTSLHFNASKEIKENNYLNFDWIQRIRIFENSLKRSNVSTISYHYQKEVFGGGISASIYEYKDLRFGGYLRIGPLILGSENAFPLLFKHRHLHAADFYIALKLSPFWDNELKRRQRSKCNCD